MNSEFAGKRLLILGGSYLHNKVVEAANGMGIYTIVTDNVIDSPAKKIANKYYDIDVKDVGEITHMCREEHVDGVLTVMLDFCQIYYQQICDRLNLPCYGTSQQFQSFTRKDCFKQLCIESGVDVIPSYSKMDLDDEDIYPIIVKPTDSRSSRGQTICYSKQDIQGAIEFASSHSNNKEIVFEKYLGDKEDFQVTYLVVNGDPYVVRTADRYLGNPECGMDRVAIALSSPSKNSGLYMNKVHSKIVELIKRAGITNSPLFFQGFVDGDTIRFYDPGLRFPGGEYDRVFAQITGINLMETLIQFAFTGQMNIPANLRKDTWKLNGNYIFTLHSLIKEGVINNISEVNELHDIPEIRTLSFRHRVGDKIEQSGTVDQRICETVIAGNDSNKIIEAINEAENTIKVFDKDGVDMVFCKYDTNKWIPYKEQQS